MQERKFLDLDNVCDEILDDNDRKMFSEAIRCYQIGSHRAAVILAWSVTADRLSSWIDDLASENDGIAQAARTALHDVENTARYEEVLITQARQCDLLDEYDEKCLRFTRDTRSKCAHPTGVIPSAEAVRHILYICSQVVLCRNGYRGISFVQEFVKTKLKDRHLFGNHQRIQEDCKYFIEKVSSRVRVQFGAEITKQFNSSDQNWIRNMLVFLRQLFLLSDKRLSKKIATKLQGIEGKDRVIFSIIVGLSKDPDIWETQEINQSKAHLRETLATGKVEFDTFHSFGNLCSLTKIEEEDSQLLKARFSSFIEHISTHKLLQESCGAILISLVVDGLGEEENVRSQIRKGLKEFSCLTWVFTEQTSTQNILFIDQLIQSDWRDQDFAASWQNITAWSSPLISALLVKSSDYLAECSEDFPDDVLILFEAASSLVQKAPNLLDGSFEKAIIDVIEGTIEPTWYSNKGESYRNFMGQTELLKERYTVHFPRIAELDFTPEVEESIEEMNEH